MEKIKLKRNISIERLELILSTLNTNLIKKIYVRYIDSINGYHNGYIIQIGCIKYYINTNALTPEKKQTKNEKVENALQKSKLKIISF